MARYINSDFDNAIIDAVFETMLRYLQHNVSYRLGVIDLFNKEWYYNKASKRIWNHVHDWSEDGEDIKIEIGLSKDYDGYFIMSDAKGGRTIEVKSKANSLGGIVDSITEDILNIEDKLYKEIENGFLI